MTAAPATSGPAPAATMASTAIAGVDAAAPAASAQPVVAVALAPAPTSAPRIEYAQVAAAVSSAVTPEHVEENTAHILGVARLLQRGEGAPSSMTLHLQPAHLGRVRVELRSLNGDLTVHLAAEHRSGVDIISAALPSLRASLEGDGVRVADVNVSTNTSGGQDSNLAQRQAATDLADQRREHRPDGTPRHDGRGVASNDQDSTTPRMAPQPVDLADGALDLDL